MQLVALVVFPGLGCLFLLFIAGKWLERREPYRSFIQLRLRQKLAFLRRLGQSPDVPRRVKLIPVLLLAYLAFPLDLVPDFIPLLGYIDDVALVLLALVLIIRVTPRAVVEELLTDSAEA